MKKGIVLALVLILVLSLIGCNQQNNTNLSEDVSQGSGASNEYSSEVVDNTNDTEENTSDSLNDTEENNSESANDSEENNTSENSNETEENNTSNNTNDATENTSSTNDATENTSNANETSNNESSNEESTEADSDHTSNDSSTEETSEELIQIPLLPEDLKNDIRPVVTITMTDEQQIKIMLVPEIAPNTVNNFIFLIDSGYYDDLTFHRIIKNFMIQGGDPLGSGAGGPGYTIKDEFYVYDKEKNTVIFLPHYRGVVSMAKTMAPDSAGSQFFIVHQDAHHLNGQYAAFGFVLEGMEVVDALTEVKTGANDKPVEDVVIKSMTVELNGYEYKAPEVIQ